MCVRERERVSMCGRGQIHGYRDKKRKELARKGGEQAAKVRSRGSLSRHRQKRRRSSVDVEELQRILKQGVDVCVSFMSLSS